MFKRGHIHNDDGCIWDIYDIEKQVFWDLCHDFSVGVIFTLGTLGYTNIHAFLMVFLKIMVIVIVNHGHKFNLSHGQKELFS